jgi:hypothetical protein
MLDTPLEIGHLDLYNGNDLLRRPFSEIGPSSFLPNLPIHLLTFFNWLLFYCYKKTTFRLLSWIYEFTWISIPQSVDRSIVKRRVASIK